MSTREGLRPLGRKQSSSQEHWLEVWGAIRSQPDPSRARHLVETAAAAVERRLARVPRQRVGWLWSGGKDSLGLQPVMEAVGLTRAAGALTPLDWPEFIRWFHAHRPGYVEHHEVSRVNLRWLSEHPDYLFPTRQASRWFPLIQRRAEREFSRRHGLEIVIGGWRASDGNHLGRDGSLEYASRDHIRFGPIAQWSHEDLLEVLAVYSPDLPPIYGYPRGFPCGTGAWAARPRLGSTEESWDEVYHVSPETVESAAIAGITGADDTLRRNR